AQRHERRGREVSQPGPGEQVGDTGCPAAYPGNPARDRERRPDQQQPDADPEPDQDTHQQALPSRECTSMPSRSKLPTRGGVPPDLRSSPALRSKIGSISITSFSTRPGTPTISLTRRMPCGSMPRWMTRSTLAATVGTTKRADTFSPASSGNVHILTNASRAEFAWRVHM